MHLKYAVIHVVARACHLSGIKLRMLHFRGKPDTPVGAQKWGAKLLPDRNLNF